jgi:hypothetical protein
MIRTNREDRMAAPKSVRTEKSTVPVTQAVATDARVSRGPVDAPGKRHRKPPPQESIDTRLGEPRGKKMGQKGVKAGWRSGR